MSLELKSSEGAEDMETSHSGVRLQLIFMMSKEKLSTGGVRAQPSIRGRKPWVFALTCLKFPQPCEYVVEFGATTAVNQAVKVDVRCQNADGTLRSSATTRGSM